jgi:hypothetical protein
MTTERGSFLRNISRGAAFTTAAGLFSAAEGANLTMQDLAINAERVGIDKFFTGAGVAITVLGILIAIRDHVNYQRSQRTPQN